MKPPSLLCNGVGSKAGTLLLLPATIGMCITERTEPPLFPRATAMEGCQRNFGRDYYLALIRNVERTSLHVRNEKWDKSSASASKNRGKGIKPECMDSVPQPSLRIYDRRERPPDTKTDHVICL
ncbi:hypothetical protein K449DRAFT_430329 [Hypoxylon sp. EC38]|nr:hypothetical protein K449DRAFT_430329 [Hypoxylon sp. EC38]